MAQWQNLFDTWGTISVGNSRISVRTVVLIICCLLVLLDVAVQTSTRAIVALSLNAFFVFVAIAASQFTRTVSLRSLAFSFLAGIGMMGVSWGLSSLTVMALGQNSAWRPFLVAPIEDICRIVPLLFFLWQGSRFSTCTLGATDVALIGAASGAGFAFVEDAFASTPLGSSSSPYFWVPATVVYNGHLIAGHTVWSTLAASTIGLGLLLVRNRQQSLILLLSGFAWAMLDHVAMDASIEAPSQLSGLMLFFAANGYLTFGLFIITFVTIILLDLYISFKVPPSYPEFNLPKRNQRKEAITTSWQFIQDRRRFGFALFRQKAQPSNREYAFTAAVVAQALINYHRGAPVKPSAVPVVAKTEPPHPALVSPKPYLSGVQKVVQAAESGPDTEHALAAPDFSRTVYSQSMDALVGGQRSFNTSEDETLSLGDLNKTHTPAPSGAPELMPELRLPPQYILISQLSAGGMGMIFRAKHRLTGANLAIKVLHPHVAKQAVNVKRFQQEARAACTLNHPNLVVVHDFGMTAESVPYLVMDLVEGTSLQSYISDKGVLSYPSFFNIFTQTCNALAHAHSRGVIHRDVKPSNILISNSSAGEESVRIVDFGIAKVVHGADDGPGDLTRTGDLVGSPLYMSPEQCMGNTLDARSDIYSLGTVMYYSLTGQEPFLGKNAVQTIFKHLHEMPHRPSELRPDVPPEIEQIIFCALQKHPDNRYADCNEVARALEAAREAISSI